MVGTGLSRLHQEVFVEKRVVVKIVGDYFSESMFDPQEFGFSFWVDFQDLSVTKSPDRGQGFILIGRKDFNLEALLAKIDHWSKECQYSTVIEVIDDSPGTRLKNYLQDFAARTGKQITVVVGSLGLQWRHFKRPISLKQMEKVAEFTGFPLSQILLITYPE